MGIKNINKLINYNIITIPNNIRIAIDTYPLLYRYLIATQDEYLVYILNLINYLKSKNITCIFIFDGPSHTAKSNTLQKRKEQYIKKMNNVKKIKFVFNKLNKNNKDYDYYKKIVNTDNYKNIIKQVKYDIINTSNTYYNYYIVRDLYIISLKHLLKPTSQHIKDLKIMLTNHDVNWIQHNNEGEQLCAKLCNNGHVDYAFSIDTDLIAYNTKNIITHIYIKTNQIKCISNKQILNDLHLTKSQLRELCVLCGTDYNDNIPYYGVKKVYNLIKQHKTIDNISNNINISNLKDIIIACEIFNI